MSKYTEKTDRASQLLAAIIKAGKGTAPVDVTIDVYGENVSLTITKAAPFILKCIYEQMEELCFLLYIESGGVKAVFV